MPKVTTSYVCQQCGYQSSQYFGKCPQCDSWNSLVETIQETAPIHSRFGKPKPELIDLAALKVTEHPRKLTGLAEVDRCLGGGIVPGALMLVSGEPGIGKSTLLTQLALNIQGSLYIAGEESAHQIKLRSDRLNPKKSLKVLNETDVDVIAEVLRQYRPELVVIDSIQTLQTADLQSIPGSLAQVRECAYRLQGVAKELHLPIFLVGHVTKEGSVAGPKTLEHLVDVVLTIEGEVQGNFRILRGSKNRFGATEEVGIFEMSEQGLKEVVNPSEIFLSARQVVSGSAVVPVLTGLRPLLVEIQALVTRTALPVPRRVATGIDNNRLQMLSAVVQKRLHLPLMTEDIFVNATGGIKIGEPAADLGICLSIISSHKDLALPKDAVFIGEVGLSGEVRSVNRLKLRIQEAKKLGFKHIYSSENISSLNQLSKLLFK